MPHQDGDADASFSFLDSHENNRRDDGSREENQEDFNEFKNDNPANLNIIRLYDGPPLRSAEKLSPSSGGIFKFFAQSHDFWHMLTGLTPTVPGEIALKWLELMQMGMPVAALSAVKRPIRLSAAERATILSVYVPWAVRTGRSAKHFMNVYDKKEFESDLGELRQRMQICGTINCDHTSKGTLKYSGE